IAIEPAGRMERNGQVVTALTDAQPKTAEEIAEIPIVTSPQGSSVPLRSIAEVIEGHEDRSQRIGGPRGETVAISVARQPDASTPEVVAQALAAAKALEPSLPEGASLEPVYDQALLVNESIGSVRDAILLGIVLCLGVITVFLRDVRAGLMNALSVPITLAIT